MSKKQYTIEPILRYDPKLVALAATPWFREAHDLAERAANILVQHGMDGVRVTLSHGTLSIWRASNG